MVMLVAHQHSLTSPPQPMLLIVVFEASQSVFDAGVLLRLHLFHAKRVVAEWIEAYRFRLGLREGKDVLWWVCRLLLIGRYCRHLERGEMFARLD